MDAQDFIPEEADLEVIESLFRDKVENFAEDKKKNEDLIQNVAITIDDYHSRFLAQREGYTGDSDGIFNLCDWAFRSCINNTFQQSEKKVGANVPEKWNRAQTGSTLFYRQVSQMAANGYAVQSSKEQPFKYESIENSSIEGSEEDSKQRTRRMNLLARWTLKKDKVNQKSKDFWTQVKKYGNIPVMVEWHQKKGRVMKRVNIDGVEQMEYVDTIIENHPVLKILPIESVFADTCIGNLQDQECVEVLSLAGISDIISMIECGYYRKDLLEDLDIVHQWDGSSGFENNYKKQENRKLDDSQMTIGTGKYLRWEVFVRLPIDEETGEWDEKKYVPKLYRVTMLGNSPTESVFARIERNQEPDDSIPLEMIHANPDDSDNLYHISPFEVIRSNISVQITLRNQIIDNNTLKNKPPLIEERGAVDGRDRTFGPDARWVATSVDSIKEFKVGDMSQATQSILDETEEDSNTANNLDKNQMGESYGARTSAEEAGTIASNSRRPNLVNIEYVLDQYLGFIAKRYLVLWPEFGDKDQIVQITDEEGSLAQIRPSDIHGEFDIVVDIVNDIKENTERVNNIVKYTNIAAGTPLGQKTDWDGLNVLLQDTLLGGAKYILGDNNSDAEMMARNNIKLMVEEGQDPVITQNMNIKKHLEIYKGERLRWKGYEDQNPNIEGILQPTIERLTLMQQEQKANQQQQQAQQQANPNEA